MRCALYHSPAQVCVTNGEWVKAVQNGAVIAVRLPSGLRPAATRAPGQASRLSRTNLPPTAAAVDRRGMRTTTDSCRQ